jgi:hypothetical protein
MIKATIEKHESIRKERYFSIELEDENTRSYGGFVTDYNSIVKVGNVGDRYTVRVDSGELVVDKIELVNWKLF